MLDTGLTSIAEDDSTIGGEAKFYDDSFVADLFAGDAAAALDLAGNERAESRACR